MWAHTLMMARLTLVDSPVDDKGPLIENFENLIVEMRPIFARFGVVSPAVDAEFAPMIELLNQVRAETSVTQSTE